MARSTRPRVWHRADGRCEYCRLRHVEAPWLAFHVEHIVPLKHDGTDDLSNLALACERCNLYKGSNLSGLDPASGTLARLFNPRTDNWNDHFQYQGATIIGLTDIGRTTVRVLALNARGRVILRHALIASGRFNP